MKITHMEEVAAGYCRGTWSIDVVNLQKGLNNHLRGMKFKDKDEEREEAKRFLEEKAFAYRDEFSFDRDDMETSHINVEFEEDN